MKTSKNTLVNDQKEAKKKLCEMHNEMHLGELQKCTRSITGVQFATHC